MARSPGHIPLDKRTIICARLAYFDTFPTPGIIETDLALEDLEKTFLIRTSYIGRKFTREPNEPKLDAYLRHLSCHVQNEGKSLDGLDRLGYEVYASAYVSRVEEIRCRRCSPAPGPVCLGPPEYDNKIVIRGGLCIAQLRNVFSVALEAAVFYYHKYAKLESLPTVYFWTNWDERALSNVPRFGRYAAAGTSITSSSSSVTLTLNPEELNRNAYFSLLYLLFHETICHVFQGSVRHGRRDYLGEDDIFGEGWMDVVAFLTMLELLDGITGPWRTVKSRIPHHLHHAAQGSSLFEQRGIRDDPNYISGQLVGRGRMAFRQLRNLMITKRGSKQLADEEMARLSFKINILPLTFGQRQEFTKKVLLHTKPAHIGRTLESALKSYYEDNDANAFVQSVIRLSDGPEKSIHYSRGA